MAYETILYERRGAAALVTLNRPERLNAINAAMLRELDTAMDAAEADEGVRAIVLAGAGKGFCSGFDLKEQAAARPSGVAQWRPLLQRDFDVIMRFWHSPKPTLAAVRGPSLAGGCELALACDITIAAEDAVFGEPELRFGAGIVVMLLPWLTRPERAEQLLLTRDDTPSARRAFGGEVGLSRAALPTMVCGGYSGGAEVAAVVAVRRVASRAAGCHTEKLSSRARVPRSAILPASLKYSRTVVRA